MLQLRTLLIFMLTIKFAGSELTRQFPFESENEKIFHKNLLKKFYQQKAFHGILMLNAGNKYSYCHKLLEWIKISETPLTVVTENITTEYHKYFNNEILTISCSSAYRKNVLEQLAEILNDMRYTRIIIIMDHCSFAKHLRKLRDFFKHCHQLKMLNVVVILKNFYNTHTYSQYTIFPEFQIEFAVYRPETKHLLMLPERLKDLKGYKLRTIADHKEPRSMEYYDEKNKTVLVGYIGRFVEAVSKVLNATLYFPVKVPVDKILSIGEIIKYVDNSSIDIPISVYNIKQKREEYSYPIEIGKWCILLPTIKRIETKELFLTILHSNVMCMIFMLISIFTFVYFVAFLTNKYYDGRHYDWPEILVNDMAIRGVLGQCFVSSVYKKLSLKQIYIVLLLTGLTITTMFSARLQSLVTLSPYEPEIQTCQELFESNIEVAMLKADFPNFHIITNGTLSFLYKKFKNFSKVEDYSRLRDTLDPRYAYHVTSSKMFYFNSLELYYRTKLFRYSSTMCPYPLIQFAFPLENNSYFLQRLHELSLIIWASGLMDFWMKRKAFDDVTATGRVINLNISYPEDKKPLAVQDFYWIWLYYVIFISVAITVFIFELFIHKKTNHN